MPLPVALIRAYRGIGALLIAVAVGYQVIKGLEAGHWSAVNYFSYFTILSNLIAAGVLFYGALQVRKPRSETFDLVRGAAVLYMSTTGIVFALLLSGGPVPTPWVNTIVHQLMPVVVALDWALDPPRTRLALKRTLLWLGFPLVYIAYTLIRGSLVHWYPYFFVDPSRSGGYPKVAANCLAVAVGIVALAVFITWLGNLRAVRQQTLAEASQ
jgi:hypothetical protein